MGDESPCGEDEKLSSKMGAHFIVIPCCVCLWRKRRRKINPIEEELDVFLFFERQEELDITNFLAFSSQ
jgi:hypothetical protein